MIHDPKVLILDEPTTGLDPNQLQEIRNLIIKLGKEKTVMLSTHIMQEVEAMCNRVIIINQGEIVANDQTQNLQQNATKQVITVEFDKEVSLQVIKNIKGVEEAILLKNNTWKIVASVKQDVRKELFNYAVKNDIGILTLNKEEQRLEDVFKALTKKV